MARPGDRATDSLAEEMRPGSFAPDGFTEEARPGGFTTDSLAEEARPADDQLDIPGMADELRRPMMLMVKARVRVA